MKKNIQLEQINDLLHSHGSPEETINHYQKSILDAVFRMVLHRDEIDSDTEQAIEDLKLISAFFTNLKIGIVEK